MNKHKTKENQLILAKFLNIFTFQDQTKLASIFSGTLCAPFSAVECITTKNVLVWCGLICILFGANLAS